VNGPLRRRVILPVARSIEEGQDHRARPSGLRGSHPLSLHRL